MDHTRGQVKPRRTLILAGPVFGGQVISNTHVSQGLRQVS
jgi:hypothetical protein